MPRRLINIGLVLAFSIGYMEWGQGRSAFVFQAEYEIFTTTEGFLQTMGHPLILGGLVGQLALLAAALIVLVLIVE